MATGDQADVGSRLFRSLPPWFGQSALAPASAIAASAPLVNSIVQGVAAVLAWVYALYAYAALQTRIATTTDGFLDLVNLDYFGGAFPRHAGQSDASYRAILQGMLFIPKNTRAAITKVCEVWTGVAPTIQELRVASDANAYGKLGGYGVGLNYGSLQPFLVLVDAYRPLPDTVWAWTTDADIFAAIDWVRPAGVTIGVRLNEQSGQNRQAVTNEDVPGVTDTGADVVAGSGPGPSDLDFSDPDNAVFVD